MTPDVPTGAMHAVSDSAASTNEDSLYALGPRMAAHYTRGSACEHWLCERMTSRSCVLWTNAQSHTPVRCDLFCPETPPAPLERRSACRNARFYGLEQLQRSGQGIQDPGSCRGGTAFVAPSA